MSANLGRINLPTPTLPRPLDLPRIELKEPSARFPSFAPIVVPPADLEAPEEVEPEKKEETQPEVRKLEIPVIDIEMPVPSPEVLVTAVTTAVIAVATTTVTQSLFEPIKKKVQKQLQSKVDAWKKKRKEKVSSVS